MGESEETLGEAAVREPEPAGGEPVPVREESAPALGEHPESGVDRPNAGEQCTWCGARVERHDGFRLIESPGDRGAVFCRLEHVVPWALQGARWTPGTPEEPTSLGDDLDACVHCKESLGDVRVLLVHHRGDHRIPDAFCSVDHAAAWARAGGRWR